MIYLGILSLKENNIGNLDFQVHIIDTWGIWKLFCFGDFFNLVATLMKVYCVQSSLYNLVGEKYIDYLLVCLVLELRAV